MIIKNVSADQIFPSNNCEAEKTYNPTPKSEKKSLKSIFRY